MDRSREVKQANSLIQVAQSSRETQQWLQPWRIWLCKKSERKEYFGVGVQEDFPGVKKAELRPEVLGEGSGWKKQSWGGGGEGVAEWWQEAQGFICESHSRETVWLVWEHQLARPLTGDFLSTFYNFGDWNVVLF